MKIGIIGLGRMGWNLALNISENGHEVIVYNRTKEKIDNILKENNNLIGAYSLEELTEKLNSPRIVFILIPSGEPATQMINKVSELFEKEDIIIDAGNSFYKDSITRAEKLKEKGIYFLDMGTSGGIEGARNGACFMVGGNKEAYEKIAPILKDSSVENGYGYVGESGKGHFVKMVYNGIEYAMMQAIGEGFEILHRHDQKFDFKEISKIWANGSIITGHLMNLTYRMFSNDKKLEGLDTEIGQSGEGLWTLQTALEYKVSLPAITSSIFKRFESKNPTDFSSKVIQGLRKEFGGHDSKDRV